MVEDGYGLSYEINDDSIIDCCQYFKDRPYADVALWTEDNLLKFRTESRDKSPCFAVQMLLLIMLEVY